MKRLTYADCGVMGGRCAMKPGLDFHLSEEMDAESLLKEILFIVNDISHHEESIYPFERVGVVFVYIDGRIDFAFRKGDEFFIVENADEKMEVSDYDEIGELLSAYDIQFYQIMQQLDESTFISIGQGMDEIDEELGIVHDAFRCLDMRGACKVITEVKNEGPENYIRYELGEDFYIEAYDDFAIKAREFWMGRRFMNRKHMISSYDLDDKDYRGLFDDDGNILIDEDIAQVICELSLPQEFFFIDNEYKLAMRPIGVEEIDLNMELAKLERKGRLVMHENDLLQ